MLSTEFDAAERRQRSALFGMRQAVHDRYAGSGAPCASATDFDERLRRAHKKFLDNVGSDCIASEHVDEQLKSALWTERLAERIRTSRASDHPTERFGTVTLEGISYFWAIRKSLSLKNLWRGMRGNDLFDLEVLPLEKVEDLKPALSSTHPV